MKKNKNCLANMKEMLKVARTFNYAIPQINANNLEWLMAILEAANESNSPVIIGISEGAAKYMWGFKNVVDMVKNMINFKKISIPVALHLDHGTMEGCIAALEAGFSSVMYDGSSLPIYENIANTQKILKLAKKYDASVEAEVGGIGGNEDGVTSLGEFANIRECIDMASLDIDALAVAIGSIHGIYPKEWESLDFILLAQISKLVNKPLVLHGGTGIPKEQIKKAIANGINKINVNTECQLAFAAATRRYIMDKNDLNISKKGYDPRKLLKPGYEAIKVVCIEKFKEFGSFGTFKD